MLGGVEISLFAWYSNADTRCVYWLPMCDVHVMTMPSTAVWNVNMLSLLSVMYDSLSYTVYVRKTIRKALSFNSDIKRSDLHLSESQRVIVAGPVIPLNSISVRRVVASEVETVQVWIVTFVVPPRAFERHRTWTWPHVVVLVSSAELMSMAY